MAKNVKDFGEKIGGAKKDLYAAIMSGTMDEAERKKYVRKDKIWPPYKAEKLVSSGLPQAVAFWRNEIRKTVPARPANGVSDECYLETVSRIRTLVDAVDTPEKAARFSESLDEFLEWKDSRHYSVRPDARGIISSKMINAVYKDFSFYRTLADKELYGVPKTEKEETLARRQIEICRIGDEIYAETDSRGRTVAIIPLRYGERVISKMYYYPDRSQREYDLSTWIEGRYAVINRYYRKIISNSFQTREEAEACAENLVQAILTVAQEKQTRKKKQKFPIPELQVISREGPDYRHSRHARGEFFMEHFGIRGGEFGNWMDDSSALDSMDKCYDAFHDLARVLQIHPHDISVTDQKALAIAFGARGSGSAMAHYESAGKVINLTKYRGMGCLAHEWAHALDDYIGNLCGISATEYGTMASDACLSWERSKIPAWFRDVADSIRYRDGEQREYSDFLKGSKTFDSVYSHAGHGYWSSPREMFARAFDCYVAALLKQRGEKSEYLTSHAFSYFFIEDGKRVSAIPEGEERNRIFCAMDHMFLEMKNIGWLSGYPDMLDGCVPKSPEIIKSGNGSVKYDLLSDEDGQLRLA